MTGQIPDKVLYLNEEYSLVGVRGEPLYEPFDFGLTPISPHTANWRGFISTYEINNNSLNLKSMQITVEKNNDRYPEINGVKPTIKQNGYVTLQYLDLYLKTEFTGKILIAKEFIDSMYVHMGFQSPLSFELVLEFEFRDGNLINKIDLSKKVKDYRKKGKSDGKITHGEDLMKWIERTFSLDYDF